jgi:TubC N-terminal docking domain/HEAT repeats
MTAHDLLCQLREKGVEVKTSGDERLVIDAPKGTITEDVRGALAAHKAELIQILKAEQAGSGSDAPVAEAPELVQMAEAVAMANVPLTSPAPPAPQTQDTRAADGTADEINRLEAELMRVRTEEEARRAEVEAARLSVANALHIEQERWRQVEEATARSRAEKEKQRIEVEAREQTEEAHRRQMAEQDLARAEGELKRMRAMEEARRAESEAKLRAAREAHEAELAALRKTEDEQARRRAEEERRYLEAEARKKAQEDELRRRGEARFRAVAEEIERVKAREEARLKAAEDAQRLASDAARRRAEEDARRKAEAEARNRAEAEARLRAEIETQMRAEADARRKVEEETRRRAEEEARRRAEEEAQRLAAENARRLAEQEAQRLAAEEARRQAEEAARLVAQEEARRQAEAEALRRAEEEVRLRAEAEARQRVELEERIRAEVKAKIRAEEVAREEAEEARRHAEHERIVTEQAARAAARPESVSEIELAEIDELPSPDAAFQGVDQESKVTEIAEWFDASLENRGQIPSVDTPTPLTLPEDQFGTMQEDAGGEFAPVSLPESHPAPEAVTVSSGILQQLTSEKPAERAAAVSDLPGVGGEDAFNHICAAFDDQSPEVRSTAARAMFEFQEDRAAAFTRALREASPERRRKIGTAIASSGLANEAIRNLTGESRDKTYDAFSLLFLMSKAGEIQPLIRAIEEHPNIEVRLAVVKLLALSGQSDILPAFRRMAVRGSLPPEVRSAVMEAIYQINNQSPEAQSMS